MKPRENTRLKRYLIKCEHVSLALCTPLSPSSQRKSFHRIASTPMPNIISINNLLFHSTFHHLKEEPSFIFFSCTKISFFFFECYRRRLRFLHIPGLGSAFPLHKDNQELTQKLVADAKFTANRWQSIFVTTTGLWSVLCANYHHSTGTVASLTFLPSRPKKSWNA